MTEQKGSPQWGYGVEGSEGALGPACWHKHTPWGVNIGGRQSPIPLVTSSAKSEKFSLKLPDISCANSTVHNTGKTLKFYPHRDTEITVQHPKTGDTFRMAELHFHWDEQGAAGSEHTIDGVRYPLEGHFVFMNVTKYPGDFDAAVNASDGLLVLGQMYKLGVPNPEIAKLVSSVDHLVSPGQPIPLDATMELSSLTTDSETLFHYLGSLTTPGCNESVSWFVLREPTTLSLEQLQQIYRLTLDGKRRISRNWRPLQDLAGRETFKN